MECLTEHNANPLLRLLRTTKFGITESVIRGANLLAVSSSNEPFIEFLEAFSTENCLLPEKVIKFNVCKQNNFRSINTSNDVSHENNQTSNDWRPVGQENIDCLEKEIQNSEHVLKQKRKIIDAMRNELNRYDESVIPQLETKLIKINKSVQEHVASSIDLNVELNILYDNLNQSKEKTEQTFDEKKPHNDAIPMYCTYDFTSSFRHILQRMNTDFNVLCKYIGTTVPTNQLTIDLELEIERTGNCLSTLGAEVELQKAVDHANKQCEKKLSTIKQQLANGTFKFDIQPINGLAQSQELTRLSSQLELKLKQEASGTKNRALNLLRSLQTERYDWTFGLLKETWSRVHCSFCFLDLLQSFVSFECEHYDRLFALLLGTYKQFDRFMESNTQFESKLTLLMKSDVATKVKPTQDNITEQYAVQMIRDVLPVDQNAALSQAMSVLEDKIRHRKQTIAHQYSMETIYNKLAPLRKSIHDKMDQIYSGPLQKPVLPHSGLNSELMNWNTQLLGLRLEYDNLLRRISSEEVTSSNQSVISSNQSGFSNQSAVSITNFE